MNLDKNGRKSCYQIHDDKGISLGSACVVTSKDFGHRDIIYLPKLNTEKAFSVRSSTEMINKLKEMNVPHEEIEKVMDFTDERLRSLETDESFVGIKGGPLSASKSEKKKV